MNPIEPPRDGAAHEPAHEAGHEPGRRASGAATGLRRPLVLGALLLGLVVLGTGSGLLTDALGEGLLWLLLLACPLVHLVMHRGHGTAHGQSGAPVEAPTPGTAPAPAADLDDSPSQEVRNET